MPFSLRRLAFYSITFAIRQGVKWNNGKPTQALAPTPTRW
jgi:hypothetical protein